MKKHQNHRAFDCKIEKHHKSKQQQQQKNKSHLYGHLKSKKNATKGIGNIGSKLKLIKRVNEKNKYKPIHYTIIKFYSVLFI